MPTVAALIAEGNEYVLGHIYALESQHIRSLFDAYETAYRNLVGQFNEIWRRQVDGNTWSVDDIGARNAMLSQISAEMNRLDGQLFAQVQAAMEQAYTGGYYGAAYVLDNSVMAALGNRALIPALPVEAVRAQVLAPYLGQTWIERFVDARAEFEQRIKRSLIQSQIQGDSIQDAMRRLADELGIDIDGPLAADRYAHRQNFNRVQMIARTELLRASNLGALAIYRANRDVLGGWDWATAMDDRVCPICAPLDGMAFTWDNEPLEGSVSGAQVPPPAHPQCRCSALPRLLNKQIEDAIVKPRPRFDDWAASRGLDRNRYGQVYGRRSKPAPQTVEKAA